METLLTIGVAGATPFVLQFLLDYITAGDSSQISARIKMSLSVLTGGVLGILIQLYLMSRGIAEYGNLSVVLDPNAIGWFFVALNGCIDGAVATAGVSLVLKVASKVNPPAKENIGIPAV